MEDSTLDRSVVGKLVVALTIIMEDSTLDRSVAGKLVIGVSGHYGS